MANAATFEYIQNSLHSAQDNLKNIDLLYSKASLASRTLVFIYNLHWVLKPIYSTIHFALNAPADKLDSDHEMEIISDEQVIQMFDNIKKRLQASFTNIHEMGKVLKKGPISKLMFYFLVERYMIKIAEEFEDIELLLDSLSEDTGEIVDVEKMKQLLHV